MSRLTNLQNLPEPLVRAVDWSDRDREGCDYTITELLRPPRMVQLEKIHAEDVTEDAADRLWMLLGSAGHEVLRRSANSGVVEERAIIEVDGFKVGGQIDYGITDHTIWDYKFTSVYAAKEGPKTEWTQQLNCYRYMSKQYGVEITKLKIVCIFRDWSKAKASREADYPQSQVQVFDLDLWGEYAALTFISSRICLHEAAKTTLPECTPDDTWERPAVWAVKKKGGKRALRLLDDYAYAMNDLRERGPGHEIEHRPGERPRCENYCRVAPFCAQWKAFREANP